MWRGAIAGLGNVAVHGHLPGWRGCDRAEIVAVADVVESRLAAHRSHLPGARFYPEVESLITAEGPDFLDICTPPGTHAAIAHLALRRGVHVLCEKPLVLSLEELSLVRRAQAESGCILHTVHNWRYAPIIMQATHLIQEGNIGKVRRVDWRVLRRQPSAAASMVLSHAAGTEHGNWRLDPKMAGGGILLDHGWHALYILLDWLGDDPQTIAATLETREHPEWRVEDTATLRLVFPDAGADIFLTWASSRRENRAMIEGTLGTIRMEDGVLILIGASGQQSWQFGQPLSQGSFHADWFGHVRDEFLGEMQRGARNGRNLATASLCVRLLHLAKESNSRGGIPMAVNGEGFSSL